MDVPLRTGASRLIQDDHRRIQELYQAFLGAQVTGDGTDVAEEICKELEIHTWVEERLVYPALARAGGDPDLPRRLVREHLEARRLISRWRLAREKDGSHGAAAPFTGVMTAVQAHMAGEEQDALPLLARDPAADEDLGAALGRLRVKLKMFPPIQRRADLAVPAARAYRHWTRFEAFPQFLDSIREVRRLDEHRVQWRAEVGGRDLRWTAEIHEQVPDQRIAWRSLEGAEHAGSVSFRPLGPDTCRMLVEVVYEPQGLVEDLGALLGLVSQRIATELEHFRTYVEALQVGDPPGAV
jgi:hypothetical protein